MRTIWQSLAWKEWHEHKWKLAALVAVLCGVAALTLKGASRDQFVLDVVRGLLIACIAPLALFIGLTAAAGERSRGTLPFLQALPVPMWRVGLGKFLAGLATLVAAVVVTLVLFYLGCLGLEPFGKDYLAEFSPNTSAVAWFLKTALLVVAIAAGLYIWAAAAGVNRRDEVSAGAVVAAVLVGMWCLLFLVAYYIDLVSSKDPGRVAQALGFGVVPLGFLPAIDLAGKDIVAMWLNIAVAAVVHLGLAGWYVRRFGRIANREVTSPRPAAREAGRLDWLAPPRRSPVVAIAWAQFRASLPLVLGGLVCIVGIIVVAVGLHRGQFASWQRFAELVLGVSGVCGGFLALVFGVATFFYDVEPRANEFWRSRPIGASQWFWVKFATSLAMFAATVYLLPAVVALASHSSLGLPTSRDAVLIVPIHLAVFAATMAMMCLVRQAIYAVILGIATVYLWVLACLWLMLLVARLVGWQDWIGARLEDMGTNTVVVALLVSVVLSALVGWLAVRRNWGWRR